jgi:hypothetical protein
MKILKCKVCGIVTNRIYTEITVMQSLKMATDGAFWLDGDFDHVYGNPVNPIGDGPYDCPECETFDNKSATLEVIDVDRCPHDWNVSFRGNTRECRICRMSQKGTVVFEEYA